MLSVSLNKDALDPNTTVNIMYNCKYNVLSVSLNKDALDLNTNINIMC